jgi:nitrate reductase gamma subunit
VQHTNNTPHDLLLLLLLMALVVVGTAAAMSEHCGPQYGDQANVHPLLTCSQHV